MKAGISYEGLYRKERYPIPEWKVEPNGLWVVFTFEVPEEQQETVESEPSAVDYERLEHEEIAIVEFLKEHSQLTRKQAIELLGLQRTKVTSFINNLIDKEILERHGQGRGTFYQLKSR